MSGVCAARVHTCDQFPGELGVLLYGERTFMARALRASMTASWECLFERAAAYDVDCEQIRTQWAEELDDEVDDG